MSMLRVNWLLLPLIGTACTISSQVELKPKTWAEVQDPEAGAGKPASNSADKSVGNSAGNPTAGTATGDQGDDEDGKGDNAQGEGEQVAIRPHPRPRSRKRTELRAGTQPGRLRQPQNLQEDSWALQFRLERNSGGSIAFPGASLGSQTNTFITASYGVTDDLMVSAQYADGHTYETISQAAAPGDLLLAGAQYRLFKTEQLTFAGRMDVALSDVSSFAAGPPEKTASFQPGILANFAVSDNVDIYSNTAIRFTDGAAPAWAIGAGVIVPVGKVEFFLEADTVLQNQSGPKDIVDAYLTPGLRFVLRDKIDINVAPSVGLSSTSFDWRFAVTLGVHF